jgi:hypothetical protein
MKIYLLNTTVIPNDCDGIWESKRITQSEAELYAYKSFISAIGHDSTAEIMSTLLKVNVPVNRISITPEPGDRCLCFKLAKPAPEGLILGRKQIEELGYHWALMTYHGTIGRAIDARFNYLEGWCQSLNQGG